MIWPGRLLLYDVELYGLDLHALVHKKLYGLLYLPGLPFKLKGHKADLIGNALIGGRAPGL